MWVLSKTWTFYNIGYINRSAPPPPPPPTPIWFILVHPKDLLDYVWTFDDLHLLQSIFLWALRQLCIHVHFHGSVVPLFYLNHRLLLPSQWVVPIHSVRYAPLPEIETSPSPVQLICAHGHIITNFSTLSGSAQKFHSSARNYEWNLERMSNSSQSIHPTVWVLWEELRGSYITYYSLMFFIA